METCGNEKGKQGRKVTQEDEIMRIEVPHSNSVFEESTEQRNVTYKSDILRRSSILQNENQNEGVKNVLSS